MRIEKLEIKGFGKFKDFSLNFENGFNMVYGCNEAGKSSVQTFIKGMLYGLKGGRSGKDGSVPQLKKFKPWSGADYTGFMEYRLDNGELYRIGRNFGSNSVRVFDSLFNDITPTFKVSKERDCLFAQKHLGINEACFDRTAFIRQMELKVEDDGSRELLSKLTNACQTGCEDVSFIKAQKALNDAMKLYIGTEKTSTRPLDKVNSRLEELNALKVGLDKKRSSIFALEQELALCKNSEEKLKNKRLILSKAINLLEQAAGVEKLGSKKEELSALFEQLENEKQEFEIVTKRLEELGCSKKDFAVFSKYCDDDVDRLNADFFRFQYLKEQNLKLREQIDEDKKRILDAEADIRPLEALKEISSKAENDVVKIGQELADLKSEQGQKNLDVLGGKIKSFKLKSWVFLAASVLALIFTAYFAVSSFISDMKLLPIAIVTAVLSILLFFFRKKALKMLSTLLIEKRMSFISVNKVSEEIYKKQKVLSEILESTGAVSIDDLLRLKALYDSKMKELESVTQGVMQMESSFNENRVLADKFESSMRQMITDAGILASAEEQINEECIRTFKYGINKYRGLEPGISYSSQRADDLGKNIALINKKISSFINDSFSDMQQCTIADNLGSKLALAEAELESSQQQLAAAFEASGLSPDETGGIDFGSSNWQHTTCCSAIKLSAESINNELRSIELKIKEIETLITSMTTDDDKMQLIDEEISLLEQKKASLEQTGFSLRAALDALVEASSEIQKDFVPAINGRMSVLINRLTGGKYNDLRANSSLQLKTISPETGDITPVQLLSSGTADQVYLALRLSLADFLTGGFESLPYVMDEVFAQYDDQRTAYAMEYLKELSSSRQIILFTCKKREMEIAEEIFGITMNIIML